MKLQFEKAVSNGYPARFFEKHVKIVPAGTMISGVKDAAQSASGHRSFGGQGSTVNSVLCMTESQAQSMFSWILENKKTAIAGVTKAAMTEISGIPVQGAVISYDTRVKRSVVRGGGTIKLGFQKATGTLISITHFGSHDWTGSFVLGDDKAIDTKPATA